MQKKALVALGVACGLWLWSGTWKSSDPAPPPPPGEPSSPRVDWPRGRAWHYPLAYTSRLASSHPALHLEGELVLRGYGRHDHLQWVGMRLQALRKHEWLLWGRRMLPDPEEAHALLGGEALLAVDEDGKLQALVVPPDTSALLEYLLRTWVEGLQMELRDGEPHLVLDAPATNPLRLTPRTTTAFPPPDSLELLTTGRRLTLGEAPLDVDVLARDLLSRRVGDLTARGLEEALRRYANDGGLPEGNRFLVQATGLLELEPELCGVLARLFVQPSFSSRGRALLLDLLVGTEVPEAQTALLLALKSPEAQRDPAYPLFLRRLSRVRLPSPDTTRFVEEWYDGASPGEPWRASALALGTLAGRLQREGQTRAARPLLDKLEQALREARTPEARARAIRALGGAGLPEHLALLGPHVRAGDGGVREALATALRAWTTPQAESLLLELSGDPLYPVQREALEALGAFRLEEDAFAELKQHVTSGRMHPLNREALVTLLGPFVDDARGAREVLGYLLTLNDLDGELRGHIVRLLGT